MRDAVEIPTQVRIDDFGRPLDQQRLDLLDRVPGAASRSLGVLLGLPVGLEDRFEDHHGSPLHHTIRDRWDAQRSLLAIRLGEVDPPHGLRTIRFLA